jgi:hypothetical protein
LTLFVLLYTASLPTVMHPSCGRLGCAVAVGALGGGGRYSDVDNHGAWRVVTTKDDRYSGCAAVAALGRRLLDLALR